MYAIEFRSGTFFQNLEAYNGGKLETAQKFSSKEETEKFMDDHNWIYYNGGMVVDCNGLGNKLH